MIVELINKGERSMKKILFLICVALGAVACEKDPDMGKLDADLVVYTDHDTMLISGDFKLISCPISIWRQEVVMPFIGKTTMRK